MSGSFSSGSFSSGSFSTGGVTPIVVASKVGGDDAPGFNLKAWKRRRKLDDDIEDTIARLYSDLTSDGKSEVVEAVQKFERKQINPAKLARTLARIEKRFEPIVFEEDEMEEFLVYLQ